MYLSSRRLAQSHTSSFTDGCTYASLMVSSPLHPPGHHMPVACIQHTKSAPTQISRLRRAHLKIKSTGAAIKYPACPDQFPTVKSHIFINKPVSTRAKIIFSTKSANTYDIFHKLFFFKKREANNVRNEMQNSEIIIINPSSTKKAKQKRGCPF